MSTPTEWTAQRLSDYADGYEFARQEILEQGEEIEAYPVFEETTVIYVKEPGRYLVVPMGALE